MRSHANLPALLLAATVSLGAGCVTVQWTDEMSRAQVDRSFDRARSRAEKRADRAAGKKPRRAHVLAYDPEEETFLRFSAPMWMVRLAVRHAADADPVELNGVAFDWREVLRRGAGTYVTAHDGGGQVLVWLE